MDDLKGWRMELAAVESVIENEIEQGCTQRQVAQTYALGLRSSWPTDWARVNAAIMKRWPKGLNRIKEMAWSGKCFEQKWGCGFDIVSGTTLSADPEVRHVKR